MDISIQRCTRMQLDTLHTLSCQTFRETFADSNTPEDLQAYLDRAYDPEKLLAELDNPASTFYLLVCDGVPAGYIKLNEAGAQTELRDPEALEIERIYLLQRFQGQGLGSRLLNVALERARAEGRRYVWLGVWEHNAKAAAFYKRHGFYQIGAHSFLLGSDEQADDLLRRDL